MSRSAGGRWRRSRSGRAVRLGTTIFFAIGTVFWYTAQVATTWYQAHIVAVGLGFLAVGVALRGDRGPLAGEKPMDPVTGAGGAPRPRAGSSLRVDPGQFAAGLLFGLACTARLTVVFGAPFFAFVGSGDGWRRRAWSAGLGAALPVGLLVLYNLVTTGHVFHPAYDYLYALEANGYPGLGYHADWAMEDPRYLAQNTGIALLGLPDLLPRFLPDSLAAQPVAVCTDPGAVRGLFDLACPLAVPRDVGMSVLLTSPAFLLAVPVLGRVGRSRLVAGAVLAVVLISVVNLMHFSQGWVQFGYRFSLDAVPFALVARRAGRRAHDRPPAARDGRRRRAARRLGRGEPVGRRLEPAARMVNRIGWLRHVPALLVALVAFGAARAALLPGVAFWDTGELQTVAPLLGTAHPTGVPTYVLVGWLASVVLQPFGEPAFRMNLLNAICLAVAAGLTVDLVRVLTRSTALGVLAGLGLALTPIAWAIGTHADAHALHLVFVVLLLRLLVAWEGRVRWETRGPDARSDGRAAADLGDRYLIAAAAVFGLALGTHSLILLTAPAVGAYLLAVDPAIRERRRLVIRCAAALAIAVTLVFLELPLRAGPFRAPLVYGRPETFDGFWYVALGQQFMGSLVDPFGDLPRKVGDLAGLALDQFGPLAVLIPIGFVVAVLRRRRYALLTGLSLGLICFFAASYENADIDRYYLVPILIAWTWLAILARSIVDALAMVLRAAWSSPSAGRGWLGGLLSVVIAALLLGPTVLGAPARLATVDESSDHTAADWTDRVLGEMEPNAVIVSWWSYSTPLWYAQRVEGRRPDLTIIDDRTRLDEGLGDITDVIDANLGTRPVYVIRSDPDEVVRLSARYQLEPIDGAAGFDLTRVVARLGAGS